MEADSHSLRHREIDLDDPVNRYDPLARGRIGWWLALPGKTGGRFWYDLYGRYPSTFTRSDELSGWRGTTRPGAAAEFAFGSVSPAYFSPTGFIPPTSNDSRTISIWFRTPSSGSNMTLYDQGATSTLHRWLLYINGSSGKLVADFAGFALTGTAVVNDGKWHHACVTYQDIPGASPWFVYADGKQDASVVSAGMNTPSSTPRFGCSIVNDGQFAGSFDDIQYWNRALSAAEVWSLYSRTRSGYADMLNLELTPEKDGFGWPITGMFLVSAMTSMTLSGTGGVLLIGGKSVSATTTLTLTTSTHCFTVGDKPVNATSTVSVSASAGGFTIGNKFVSATSNVTLTAAALGFPIGPKFVSALSHVNLSMAASCIRVKSFLVSASDGFFLSDSGSGRNNMLRVAASSAFVFSDVAVDNPSLQRWVSATSGFVLRPVAPEPSFNFSLAVSASSSFTFSDAIVLTANRTWECSATSIFRLSASAHAQLNRALHASATTTLAFVTHCSANGQRGVAATTQIRFGTLASEVRDARASAASTLAISVACWVNRDLHVSATTHLNMAGGGDSNHYLVKVANSGFTFSMSASATIGHLVASDGLIFRDRAEAVVQLPSGDIVYGGDANAGLRAVVRNGVSGTFPMSFAETPGGLLLIANGVDPMIRWSGLSGTSDAAGVQPPSTAIRLAGSGVGTLTGLRRAYCRFIDALGNPSCLSPVSNAVNLGRDAAIDGISYNPTTGVVTIWSAEHGLVTGEAIVISGVGGLQMLNGTFAVTVLDPDHFTVNGLRVTAGRWTSGGSWTWGIASVVYQGLPIPTESKVVRRQVLRNLDGSADTFYVDIDTTDLLSSNLTSTRTDEDLATSEAVPLFDDHDIPFANRYGVPLSHKAVVVSHLGRIFAAVDVEVTAGCVLPRLGATTIQGIGTDWKANFAGRYLYVSGATQAHEIAAVDVAGQVITMTAPYAGTPARFAPYVIRPAPAERKLVYYSEPTLVESWPAWNGLAVPDDSDEITGLYSKDGFLYAVERRHIYRLNYDGEPAQGIQTLAARRGAINHRVVVEVEGSVYMLDEVGIHQFDGQATEAISTPIQSIFQADGQVVDLQVDWSADDTLWHGVADPVRETIRWFVTMVGSDAPRHAICYGYRNHRWWIEQYPTPITSSATGSVGYRRALAGTSARRVLVLSEGNLDLASADGSTLRGTVTSATSTTLADAAAHFASNLAGMPVSIVEGTGRGQQAIIASNTATTLQVVRPWATIPDATSLYQIGGVPWRWRSGWFETADDEESNPRDVTLIYQPTVDPATIDLELCFDHEDTPRVWGYDEDQDGIVVANNSSVIQVGTQTLNQRKGHAIRRFGGHSDTYGYSDQFVSVVLSGVQATQSIRIFQVTINGASGSEDS